ncbi:hypothetical protein P152DRAFT_457551 [Eremomyces bilateralis CBS 781.70]|uniref:Protein FYV10 n=1 Tax=Eremomyces bilateralis CBS 781.70 TaxID=1392243 RepID=A0A6G1G517_9PEZI|nr:uncharacterized protein P152DRAFT_457551 [Eremomyces bilateralis CBS 781.70]KAF1813185.1 hypothetical protein P152DRAFT_457551 [Eremomyces bilateralis CBS 781.70]
MADFASTHLNPDEHLLLDQPLLRLPLELNRKNLRTAQREIDSGQKKVPTLIKNAVNAALAENGQQDPSAKPQAELDATLTRLKNLKRKLTHLDASSSTRCEQLDARLQHLDQLHSMDSLADVKYEVWSRVRLDCLLIDYLLRAGYVESAKQLAIEKNVESLVDIEAFEAVGKIENALRRGSLSEALAWCEDNKSHLRKMGNSLEFELRLQQYIEAVRTGRKEKLIEATLHARKHLAPHHDTDFAIRAAGLLAFSPDTAAEPYATLYSPSRYPYLANLFLTTHHALFSLPTRPLLDIALTAGLSALKTPTCHSAFNTSSSGAAVGAATATVCPICSTELNELAKGVPYAHHSKSHVDSEPVVLPNGRIYGRERLENINEKLGTEPGHVRDPGEVGLKFREQDIKKVFIL